MTHTSPRRVPTATLPPGSGSMAPASSTGPGGTSKLQQLVVLVLGGEVGPRGPLAFALAVESRRGGEDGDEQRQGEGETEVSHGMVRS
ncbi:MAG: hypothetical protein U0797_10870 [Gemmataceae bacterium]